MNNTRYKIILAYNGTGFFGWQRQADKPTVQAAVEDALSKIYGAQIAVTGSGRTDEGVHACGQAAHFDTNGKLPDTKIPAALNAHLPPSVRVLSCSAVSGDFHARKSAKQKTYCYDFYPSDTAHPLLYRRALHISPRTDIRLMQQAATLFIGTHNFNAFHCCGSSAQTTVRTVTECKIEKLFLYNIPAFRLHITANGFLYKMVRIIAGSLIRTGEGKLTQKQLSSLLESGADWPQKVPADPYGLYLYKVEYK
ncbi:MAG: tRNA pseudouridine(38-40) synthase TruA [Firmicutes bacterium]|nr:tRNA pseudouridine(38-40) synthase TruA [Bacillota bacterium]